MQLKYGSYPWDANSVEINKVVEFRMDDAERPYSYGVSLHVSGRLFASGQAACATAESALHTALLKPNQDLIFYNDGGSKSAIQLTARDSLMGVTISNIRFGSTHGAELAEIRSFEFDAHAEYALPNTARRLKFYRETIALSGGKPLRVVRPAINGPSQEQVVYPVTPYRAMQTGEAVGLFDWPPFPPEAFPGKAVGGDEFQQVRDTAKRRANNYQDFPINWSYAFVSATPLVGVPTQWPLSL